MPSQSCSELGKGIFNLSSTLHPFFDLIFSIPLRFNQSATFCTNVAGILTSPSVLSANIISPGDTSTSSIQMGTCIACGLSSAPALTVEVPLDQTWAR